MKKNVKTGLVLSAALAVVVAGIVLAVTTGQEACKIGVPCGSSSPSCQVDGKHLACFEGRYTSLCIEGDHCEDEGALCATERGDALLECDGKRWNVLASAPLALTAHKVTLRWTAPAGYMQGGFVDAIGQVGDDGHWGAPVLCTLTDTGGGVYECDLSWIRVCERIEFAIRYEDPRCSAGYGFSFDLGDWACGACEGLGKCEWDSSLTPTERKNGQFCTKTEVGTTVALVDGQPIAIGRINNGDENDCTVNGTFEISRCPKD